MIDAFSRMLVGWQLAANMRKTLVLDALRMALGPRAPGADVALVHHSDAGSLGGFNSSSQRLIEEGCDGQAEGVGVGSHGAAGDVVAGAAAGGRCRGAGGRVGRGGCPVVSGEWRHADCHSGPVVGALSVVR